MDSSILTSVPPFKQRHRYYFPHPNRHSRPPAHRLSILHLRRLLDRRRQRRPRPVRKILRLLLGHDPRELRRLLRGLQVLRHRVRARVLLRKRAAPVLRQRHRPRRMLHALHRRPVAVLRRPESPRAVRSRRGRGHRRLPSPAARHRDHRRRRRRRRRVDVPRLPDRGYGRAGGFASDELTLEACAAFCAGHDLFGAEYGRECYCGDGPFAAGAVGVGQAECSMPCAGDAAQVCGAGNRLSVYTSVS
ncbi:hypothetical protein VTK26DRAFT_513 [Humicola hyalothermophila]